MQWYLPEGDSPRELSPRARFVTAQLAHGSYQVDFELLADILLERLYDEIPDCEKLLKE